MFNVLVVVVSYEFGAIMDVDLLHSHETQARKKQTLNNEVRSDWNIFEYEQHITFEDNTLSYTTVDLYKNVAFTS